VAADPARKRATYADVLAAPAHMTAEVLDGELHLTPRPARNLRTAARSWRHALHLSVRAETQVSALNKAANGAYRYESSIVQMIPGGAGARAAALSLERQLVYDYLKLVGRKPFGVLRP
jgi:hypothetical protein